MIEFLFYQSIRTDKIKHVVTLHLFLSLVVADVTEAFLWPFVSCNFFQAIGWFLLISQAESKDT
ncbi:MAG: hypothetical protein CVT92_13800 [Bacteroidetes bacterium HGW-Bacteroidetes-1]|nr:MAG: hypothetical protein CVT92_13800 [Bacteroidetes bacterium HGW-Bacteroidetes-1]